MTDNPEKITPERIREAGTCPACGAPSEADGLPCDYCLAEGHSPDAARPAAQPEAEAELEPEQPEAGPDQPQAGSGGLDEEGPSLAGAIPLAPVVTPPEPEPAAPPPASEPPNEASDEYFIARLDQIRRSGAPAVVFMGFASAGKTWLVHRFLEQARLVDDHSRNFSKVGVDEPEGRELAATEHFNFYQVKNEEEPYWLIDTPGEQTRLLMSGREADFQQAWKIIAALHAASSVVIALPADIVLMGPAIEHLAGVRPDLTPEDMSHLLAETGDLTGEEAETAARLARDLLGDHNRIETFVDGIIDAVAAVSFVRSINLDPLQPAAFHERVSLEAVQDHRNEKRRFLGWGGGARGLDCPTFFALTKADMIISTATDFLPESGNREVFEQRRKDMLARPGMKALKRLVTRSRLDAARNRPLFSIPAELVGAVNPALHSRLIRAFHLARFDYVTAFFGHDATSKRLKYQDYKGCPPLGIEEMRQWIYEARRLHRRWSFRRWQHRAARWLHMGLNNINRRKTGI